MSGRQSAHVHPMVRDHRHDSAYILGAICPARGVDAAVITPAVNAEYINAHLQELSTQFSPNAIAAAIWDGAEWHQQDARLKVPNNIVLLPPYAPELNPMENVWDYLRANKLSARAWDDYDAIIEACRQAWNWLTADRDRIRSIGTRTWATVKA